MASAAWECWRGTEEASAASVAGKGGSEEAWVAGTKELAAGEASEAAETAAETLAGLAEGEFWHRQSGAPSWAARTRAPNTGPLA